MKLKNKLALGLSGLAMALYSGCPNPKPESSSYTFYTDEQEIQERFVEGDNVDVSDALDYNPLEKSLASYINSPLKAIRTIQVQYEGLGLEQAVAIANQYTDMTEIDIGEGTFGSGDNFVMPQSPLTIKGEGQDKTTLKYIIYPLDFLELSGTRMEGANYDIGEGHITIALGIPNSAYIHDNLFYGVNGAVAIEPTSNTILENNTFDSVIHPEYQVSISFERIEGKDNKGIGDLVMRYNEIRNTPVGIRLFHSANAGVHGDLGNNLFLDVGTVVYNPEDYPQDFQGNAWAETNNN